MACGGCRRTFLSLNKVSAILMSSPLSGREVVLVRRRRLSVSLSKRGFARGLLSLRLFQLVMG